MTNKNKLIVGAVVVLGAFYLYDRSKKMKALAELKAKAVAEAKAQAIREEKALGTKRPMGSTSLNTITEII